MVIPWGTETTAGGNRLSPSKTKSDSIAIMCMESTTVEALRIDFQLKARVGRAKPFMCELYGVRRYFAAMQYEVS